MVRRQFVVMLGAALLAGACSSMPGASGSPDASGPAVSSQGAESPGTSPGSSASSSLAIVTVRATDTGIEGVPVSTPVGTFLVFNNAGSQPDQMYLLRRNEGVTTAWSDIIACGTAATDATVVGTLTAGAADAAIGLITLDTEGSYLVAVAPAPAAQPSPSGAPGSTEPSASADASGSVEPLPSESPSDSALPSLDASAPAESPADSALPSVDASESPAASAPTCTGATSSPEPSALPSDSASLPAESPAESAAATADASLAASPEGSSVPGASESPVAGASESPAPGSGTIPDLTTAFWAEFTVTPAGTEVVPQPSAGASAEPSVAAESPAASTTP